MLTTNSVCGFTLTIDTCSLPTSIPQNTGFLYGRFGFDQDEPNRLAKAFERVDSEKCHKFFDDTIASLQKQGQIAPRDTMGRIRVRLAIFAIPNSPRNIPGRGR